MSDHFLDFAPERVEPRLPALSSPISLEAARAITRRLMPNATVPDALAYEDATYWLVPAYVPDAELRAGSPVPVVRKATGGVEWLLPHVPPVSLMGEV